MTSQNINTHFASIACKFTNSLVGKGILELCSYYQVNYPYENAYKMPDFVWEKIKDD